MNAGSRNQQSYGFDLSFLTKLGSTKSADQKTTLIHFLATTAENKFPDIMDFAQELRNLDEATKSMGGWGEGEMEGGREGGTRDGGREGVI